MGATSATGDRVRRLSPGEVADHAALIEEQENQQLGLPVDLVGRFSPRLQELVGYGIYHGLIDHIDKRDPRVAVLGAEEGTTMLWEHARPSDDDAG